MGSTRPSRKIGVDHVKNNSVNEKLLNRNTIIRVVQSAGWPNATLTDHDEIFSMKGWLTRSTIDLEPAVAEIPDYDERIPTKPPPTVPPITKIPTAESSFSSIMKGLMPPPPKPPPKPGAKTISIPTPKTRSSISIKVSHLRDLKTSLKYMDDWLGTFSNRNIFTSCSPAIGHRSVTNGQSICWVHDRSFIQLSTEKSDAVTSRAKSLAQLQKIATEFDNFLRGDRMSSSEANPSALAIGYQSQPQMQTDSSIPIHIHTYPEKYILTHSTHHLTINLPSILRLLLPSTDRNPQHTQYKIHTLENSILTPDGTENVSGLRVDGLFGFKVNKNKSGKEVVVFLVGNSEKYLVWMVKVEVLVMAEKAETEVERLEREVEEKDWEVSLAEGGCLMIQS